VNLLHYAWLIPVFPLVLSPIPLLFGKRMAHGGGFVAIASLMLSTILSLALFFVKKPLPYYSTLHWVSSGVSYIDLGIYVDHLSELMSALTAFISLLILVYSLEYMGHEEGLPRYWTEMMVFSGSMMGLALAGTIITMYVFWELVGVCSYLLIGFWYTKPEAAAAAKKAFVVTRVGDVGFLVALVILYLNAHTLSLPSLLSNPSSLVISPVVRTTIALGIFVGAIGKSAQLPLHTWLPDAMEGPTTVSALIHSATMVAAGVYLVARLYPLFQVSPYALEVVALVGALSAFLASTMALVSYDLKRILAYSTMSQLGYMMAGLGVGAFGASMFHLLNHAIFKSMLFLSAGAVLHVLGGERDIRKMGGLFRKMKVTSLAFLFGALALSGIFPFNGFFSKDVIIGAAYRYGLTTGDYLVYALTLVTAILTAFYIFRAFFIAYVLPPKVERQFEVHEVPRVMTVPMVTLMALTLITGWLWTPFDDVFQPYVLYSDALPLTQEPTLVLSVSTLIASLAGIFVAYSVYPRTWIKPELVEKTSLGRGIRTLLEKGYYFDASYNAFARGVTSGWCALLDFFDRRVIDGVVNGIAAATLKLGQRVRKIETGRVRNYAAAVVLGVIVILVILVVG